jgi:hypothetical protein
VKVLLPDIFVFYKIQGKKMSFNSAYSLGAFSALNFGAAAYDAASGGKLQLAFNVSVAAFTLLGAFIETAREHANRISPQRGDLQAVGQAAPQPRTGG